MEKRAALFTHHGTDGGRVRSVGLWISDRRGAGKESVEPKKKKKKATKNHGCFSGVEESLFFFFAFFFFCFCVCVFFFFSCFLFVCFPWLFFFWGYEKKKGRKKEVHDTVGLGSSLQSFICKSISLIRSFLSFFLCVCVCRVFFCVRQAKSSVIEKKKTCCRLIHVGVLIVRLLCVL